MPIIKLAKADYLQNITNGREHTAKTVAKSVGYFFLLFKNDP
jgi:hypothetical protein